MAQLDFFVFFFIMVLMETLVGVRAGLNFYLHEGSAFFLRVSLAGIFLNGAPRLFMVCPSGYIFVYICTLGTS